MSDQKQQNHERYVELMGRAGRLRQNLILLLAERERCLPPLWPALLHDWRHCRRPYTQGKLSSWLCQRAKLIDQPPLAFVESIHLLGGSRPIPWEQSSGPRTEQGKAAASRNAWPDGHREMLGKLSRVLKDQRDVLGERWP